jgi:hypothetical protein
MMTRFSHVWNAALPDPGTHDAIAQNNPLTAIQCFQYLSFRHARPRSAWHSLS